MALTQEEKQSIKDIVYVVFGRNVADAMGEPTERTLELTEEALLKLAACHGAVESLIHSIPTGIVGRGFLRKNLRWISKAMLREVNGFAGCRPFISVYLRNDLIDSTR